MNVLVDGFVLENTYQKGIRRYIEQPLLVFRNSVRMGACGLLKK
jgi:hypothetical protein